MRGLIFLIFLSAVFTVFGQDVSNHGTKNIKLDLFRAAQGTIQLTHEHLISPNYSINIGLMGTYASTRGLAKPYLNAQEFTYKDVSANKTYTLANVEALGYGINIQVRKYLAKFPSKQLKGFYIGSELFYRRLNLTSMVENETKEIKRNLNLGYMGYVLGYQKIVRDIICLDTYIGGGFFLSKYADEQQFTHYRNNYQIDFTGMYINMGVLVGIVR